MIRGLFVSRVIFGLGAGRRFDAKCFFFADGDGKQAQPKTILTILTILSTLTILTILSMKDRLFSQLPIELCVNCLACNFHRDESGREVIVLSAAPSAVIIEASFT